MKIIKPLRGPSKPHLPLGLDSFTVSGAQTGGPLSAKH